MPISLAAQKLVDMPAADLCRPTEIQRKIPIRRCACSVSLPCPDAHVVLNATAGPHRSKKRQAQEDALAAEQRAQKRQQHEEKEQAAIEADPFK